MEAEPLVMEMAAESPRARPEAAAAAEQEEQGWLVVAVSAVVVAVRRTALAIRREALGTHRTELVQSATFGKR